MPQNLNQNCAEMMLIKAAQLVLGQELIFQYTNPVPDTQVDISSAFMFSPNEEKQVWHSGNKKEHLEHDLKKLDKSKVYFCRTGTNGGAGHWQTLYFDQKQKGWIAYSTAKNNYPLTSEHDSLTTQGQGLLTPHGKWGSAHGEYSFLLVEASVQNLINGANYLYDYRTAGLERAEENSWVAKTNFYPQVQVSSSLTKKEKEVIKVTASSQGTKEKSLQYRTVLEELITAVKRLGLFGDINNKIAINEINTAKAAPGESDEDFAKRLQEAEFRKVGLN